MMPTEVILDGIILISSAYGWLKDYIVETESNNTVWSTTATLVNCTRPFQLIIFPNSVSTKGLRITVTLTHKASRDLYSRIKEIIPVVADNMSGTTTTTTTTASSDAFQSNSTAKSSAPSGSPTQTPQPQTILAGLFGGILRVSLLVLVVVWLRKRQQSQIQIARGERYAAHSVGTPAKPCPMQELQDTSRYPELSA